MPPPPVTPSPHRFAIKKEAPARKTPLVQEYKPPPPPRPSHLSTSQQFNATPRFTVSSTLRPTATQGYASATPFASRYLTPAGKATRNWDRDAIELSSDDVLGSDIHESIETEEHGAHDEDANGLGYMSTDAEDEDEYLRDAPSPKRRRLSTSPIAEKEADDHHDHEQDEDSLSSSLPLLSSPPAPRRPISTAASRFITPAPAPPSTPAPNIPHSTFRKPPPFRPPDPTEKSQSHSDPLPEHFSPHRKGRKYIPNGLAAELQGWLFNVGSTISMSKGQRGKEDPWVVRLVVDEVSGGSRTGMTLVRGRQVYVNDNGDGDWNEERMVEHLGEVRVILAGEGQGVELQKARKVEKGMMVGIKGPVWEVVLEGVKWGVGVDWKVLGG